MKKNNGSDTMNKCSRKQKLREYKKLAKIIERRLIDDISRAEAKLLLHVLIHHFDGFARQQKLINRHMAVKYHWGNKRTKIDVVDRRKSITDNWTLFFIVRGFLKRCRERIDRAIIVIGERLRRCQVAVLSICRMREQKSVT